ncbi:hypothetical protein GE09DRAFT_1072595 [Coniochaeta sp. 2T2.1]|nr:hypothetical protein GE09DRAFT_1072595 [Coniochaeta sp. 2T2.1]
MASYSIFPRAEQPPGDQSASTRAAAAQPHSRFVEGSMNDRVSNAPPPTFLGPEEMAAYERQFYADHARNNSRPTSGSDQSFSNSRNSGSKFWEGLRDRFSMSRAKSSSSITTVSSNKSKASNRFSQQSQLSQQSQAAATAIASPSDKENAPSVSYPSREEVLQNYKSLVEAGFFSSHAIQGTRHQPPPSRPGTGVPKDHPLPAPLPPARDAPAVPFSQLVAQKQRQIQRQNQTHHNPAASALSSSLFASIPYSATQPSPTGDAPLTDYPRPDPRPPISLPKKYRRPNAQHHIAASMPPPPTPISPNRGTKRAMADMTGGNASTDNIATTALGGPEGGTRKLVKKLRKSASRISADLSLHQLRPATSAGNAAVVQSDSHQNSPYGSATAAATGSTRSVHLRGAASSTSVNLVPRPPISSAGKAAMGVVRNLSNSFKRNPDPAKATTIAVGGANFVMQDRPTPIPPPSNAPRKLSKVRSLSRRVSLGRSRSGNFSTTAPPLPNPTELPPPPVPSHAPPPVPSHAPPPVPIHRPQPSPTPFSSDPEATPRPSTTSFNLRPSEDSVGGDPMMIDNPSPVRPSIDAQPGGLSVPSFHYPQRQKVFPLAVVPDANRVVASPPRGTGQGKGGHNKSGSFCFGTPVGQAMGGGMGRDSALGGMGMGVGMNGVEGDEGKENKGEIY